MSTLAPAWADYLAYRNYSIDLYNKADKWFNKNTLTTWAITNINKWLKAKDKVSPMYTEADTIYRYGLKEWEQAVLKQYPNARIVFAWSEGTNGFSCLVFKENNNDYKEFNSKSDLRQYDTETLPPLEERIKGLNGFELFEFRRVKL